MIKREYHPWILLGLVSLTILRGMFSLATIHDMLFGALDGGITGVMLYLTMFTIRTEERFVSIVVNLLFVCVFLAASIALLPLITSVLSFLLGCILMLYFVVFLFML